MMEAKKDIFDFWSNVFGQEGMVYGTQVQGLVLASSTDRVQRTWGQMQVDEVMPWELKIFLCRFVFSH